MIELRAERKVRQSEYEVAGTTGTSFCVVNPHCLENIVRLSELIEAKASIDVVDNEGVKLWPCGASVSRALYERIQKRCLRQPLEVSVEIEHGVSMDSVIGDCHTLIERNPALEALAGQNGVQDLVRGLRSMVLPGPLKLLLTSARELRRHHYNSSLAAMIVSASLAHYAGVGKHDTESLILAALMKDIGQMYITPEYLDGARELSPCEWNLVIWHPCAGEMFLKEFTQFPAAVKDGVLHHHERFNGHGYPFRLKGERLGGLHTLLGAADTVAAIIMRGGTGIADRVFVALRILPGEFPPPVVNFVTDMLAGLGKQPSDGEYCTIAEYIRPELKRFRAVKRETLKILRGEHSLSLINAVDLVLDLLLRIDQSLGAKKIYCLLQQEVPENDLAIMSLIKMIPAETSWRLRNLARNVYLQVGQSGNSQDLVALTRLIALLTPFRPQ